MIFRVASSSFPSLSLACTALACLALAGACSTETKTGASSLVDASAPSSDAGTATDASASADGPNARDAGTLGTPSDAGSSGIASDAGSSTTSDAAVDAGTKVGATSTNDAPERPALGKSTPFDRILVKPKAMGDVEALKALIERKTGHKLALVRRTAGKWLLLQFKPTSKGRDEGDQAKLVDVLKGMDDFASVEGDRLMKVKQP